jgi:hypothetical protein
MADNQLKKDSILLSIKHKLGIDEVDYFDQDVIIDINTALFKLNQIGVGPKNGFSIEDENQTWNDFLGPNKNLEAVKTLVYLEVKLIFDPPTSGVLMESCNKQIAELTCRLNVAIENDTGGDL